MRGSLLIKFQVRPVSSERYNPAAPGASITAYTRLPRAVAMPTRPHSPPGSPLPRTSVQVSPPSVDLYSPLPGPPLGGYWLHGVRRARHIAAYNKRGFSAANARSIAPTSAPLSRILRHVAPPSADRYTPRSSFGP